MKNIHTNRSFDDLIGEEWRQLLDFPNYMVSNLGRVKSLPNITSRKKILKQRINKYPFVTLYKDGGKKFKKIFVHRLVALLFIANTENKPYVNHKNAIKTGNSYNNLEWVTSKENAEHAKIMGLIPKKYGKDNPMFGMRGAKHHRSKKVSQFSQSGKLIQTFYGILEASRITGLHGQNISKVCLGIRKMCGGFIFKYAS